MTTKVQKWGNSLALRLPKEIAKGVGLRQGSDVLVAHDGNLISIRPVSKLDINLKKLLDGIKKTNRHKEIDWGESLGEEIW